MLYKNTRAVIYCLLFFPFALLALEPPAVMLPKVYHNINNIERYWISEKLDGVRARWDGKQLISRGGHVFITPEWFTVGFPAETLDGELWLGRGRFADTLSIVRKQQAHEGWRAIKFMVFDLPEHQGTFDQRLQQLKQLIKPEQAHIALIEQFQVKDKAALMAKLKTLNKFGAEGLMLHAKEALYRSGRSGDLLKLKIHTEAYGKVVGHKPGKGKFKGMLGSLRVEMEDGKRFSIGIGFSNLERQNPPAIGSLVQYRHQGFTKKGLPRFAVFLRERDGLEQ